MSLLQRLRDWKYRRTTRKMYLKQLAKHSGIPMDKITGMDLGTMEFKENE